MLELQDTDYDQIFSLCSKEAVDHSDANGKDYDGDPKRKRCKKYQASEFSELKMFVLQIGVYFLLKR